MTRTKSDYRAQADPRWVTVQLQIRVPWWRREQLQAEADSTHVKLVDLLADAVDRVYPPDPPERP
jgi:hypothetical protein